MMLCAVLLQLVDIEGRISKSEVANSSVSSAPSVLRRYRWKDGGCRRMRARRGRGSVGRGDRRVSRRLSRRLCCKKRDQESDDLRARARLGFQSETKECWGRARN
ncbi:hypothetical protein EX30DRAFT_150498 [Ascodesmis nigricans]|uniref:Uncharacterized protein n=1 Tax=Ascodesmis nigricans TaxID=341454 RepID=A0A4V3SJA3_9PEZI|nr:hypothetical protein EX30DRAFT_150498 [Ascodesmis nigricans]